LKNAQEWKHQKPKSLILSIIQKASKIPSKTSDVSPRKNPVCLIVGFFHFNSKNKEEVS